MTGIHEYRTQLHSAGPNPPIFGRSGSSEAITGSTGPDCGDGRAPDKWHARGGVPAPALRPLSRELDFLLEGLPRQGIGRREAAVGLHIAISPEGFIHPIRRPGNRGIRLETDQSAPNSQLRRGRILWPQCIR